MKYETDYHITYFILVACCSVLGFLIIAYGGGLMLAFLYGIITIPIAVLMGAIPLVALTLVLSIPFYVALTRLFPTRPIAGFFGSVTLAILLSAGVARGGRLHLYHAGKQLIVSDVEMNPDLREKNILITSTNYPNHCNWPCPELLYLRKVRSVSFTRQLLDEIDNTQGANVTFKLASKQDNECYSDKSSELIRRASKKDKTIQDLCIVRAQGVIADHQIFMEINRNVGTHKANSYNPFANAISAKRTRIQEKSGDQLTTNYQYTSVQLFLPFLVLWPVSIDAGPHTPAEKGLLRAEYMLKKPIDLENMLFGQLTETSE